MKRFYGFAGLLGLTAIALGGGKPLASVAKFDGKFSWIKLPAISADAAKSLAKAKAIVLDVTFPKDVILKKDKGGNQWFTFILADQGSDWKWNQTTGSGGVPANGGKIKAGAYTVSIPVAGLPSAVLAGKVHNISVGPATSGLTSPVSFSIDRLRGK